MNIDSQISDDILGTNLYLYCGNNPIERTDDEGKGWLSAAVGAAIGFAVQVTSNIIQKKPALEGTIEATIKGALIGALSPTLGIGGSTALVTSGVSTGKEVYSYATGKKEVTKENLTKSAAIVGGTTLISTGLALMGGAITKTLSVPLGITDVGRPAKKMLIKLIGKKALKAYARETISASYEELTSSLLDYTSEKVQSPFIGVF